jgi:hypothetical protein
MRHGEFYAIAEPLREHAMLRAMSVLLLAAPAAALSAELPALAGPMTIPIQVVKGFPMLVARIGERDMPLMFDLGGYADITLTSEAMRIGGVVRHPDERHSWKDAKGNLIEAARFTVKELRLGEIAFHDVDGHVEAFDESFKPSSPLGNVGHIGASLVRSYKVLLDYRSNAMTLIPGNADDASAGQAGCRGTAVPFLPELDGEPISKATTDVGTLSFVWDTGASTSIIRRGIVELPAAEGPAQDPFSSKRFELNGTDLGPLDLRPFDFSEPAEADGFIGGNFFATHVVCVDFPGKRFLVR